jgi:hypothetical protein
MKLGGRTRIATFALAAAALALAGCGGGGGGGSKLSKADYQKKLASVGKDLNGLSGVGASGSSAVSQFDRLRGGLNKAADELDKVTPPSDAQADNNELVSGLRAISGELGPLETAAKNKDAAGMSSALSKLRTSSGVTKVQHAIGDLKSKGYKTG